MGYAGPLRLLIKPECGKTVTLPFVWGSSVEGIINLAENYNNRVDNRTQSLHLSTDIRLQTVMKTICIDSRL